MKTTNEERNDGFGINVYSSGNNIAQSMTVTYNGPVYNGKGQEESETVSEETVMTALGKCGAFLWGNAAYAVPFCVCRDAFNWEDNASYFERVLSEHGIELPEGTINAAFSRNPYMRLHIDNWGGNGAMERVLKLRDEFKMKVKELRLSDIGNGKV